MISPIDFSISSILLPIQSILPTMLLDMSSKRSCICLSKFWTKTLSYLVEGSSCLDIQRQFKLIIIFNKQQFIIVQNIMMFKKIFLKGRQFLQKKLEELDIEHDKIDYVEEQIPKKLYEQIKILGTNDYDLQSTQKYASYYRIHPNHPVSPILYQIFKTTKSIEYPIKSNLQEKKHLIPQFDIELQKKAFKLKHTIDTYQQNIPHGQSPLLCICVVHFHHKRGTQIEYRYPFNQDIEKMENNIIHCAMPDSSHNKEEDYNFFNFEAIINKKKKMIFGVSYFKQIKLTESMKAKNEQLTRSHVQKAVCVISLLPIFGYLKMRLALTTKIFFQNFTNFEAIKNAYIEINEHLCQTSYKMDYSQLYIGSDLKRIVKIFGYKIFQIYKAILYQKRILVFSHSPSSSSIFILSILSLFPGFLAFGMSSSPINKYLQGLRQYSLPLKIFSSDNPLIFSFHLQDLPLLKKYNYKNCEGNYLIGTTNRLVKDSKDIGVQLLINLEDCSILSFQTTNNDIWQGQSKQQKQDKTFMDEILKMIDNNFTCGYEGSEDWIRDKFHNHLKRKLIHIIQAKKKYIQFVDQCQVYQRKSKKQDQIPPEVDQCVLKIPLIPLLNKSFFAFFLQFHNPNLHLLTEKYRCDEILMIENTQYYVGSIPMKEKEFIIYNLKTRRLKFGNKSKSQMVKQIRFQQNNQISQIFIGNQYEDKYNGTGFYMNENQYYHGQFLHGNRHGHGKLMSNIQAYIGFFDQGLYNGEGQLINQINKSTYVGNFKDGLKQGQGKFQNDELLYNGEFLENEIWGNGEFIYKNKDIKIFGNFIKGNIDQTKEVTIKYKNGDAYAGYIKDLEPHGRGTYRKSTGQLQSGLFKNGSLVSQQQLDS